MDSPECSRDGRKDNTKVQANTENQTNAIKAFNQTDNMQWYLKN